MYFNVLVKVRLCKDPIKDGSKLINKALNNNLKFLLNKVIFLFPPNRTLPVAAVREAVRARVGRGHHPPRGALHQEEDGAEPHLPGESSRLTAEESHDRGVLI